MIWTDAFYSWQAKSFSMQIASHGLAANWIKAHEWPPLWNLVFYRILFGVCLCFSALDCFSCCSFLWTQSQNMWDCHQGQVSFVHIWIDGSWCLNCCDISFGVWNMLVACSVVCRCVTCYNNKIHAMLYPTVLQLDGILYLDSHAAITWFCSGMMLPCSWLGELVFRS